MHALTDKNKSTLVTLQTNLKTCHEKEIQLIFFITIELYNTLGWFEDLTIYHAELNKKIVRFLILLLHTSTLTYSNYIKFNCTNSVLLMLDRCVRLAPSFQTYFLVFIPFFGSRILIFNSRMISN